MSFENGGAYGLGPLNADLFTTHPPFSRFNQYTIPRDDPRLAAEWTNIVGAEQGLWTYNAVRYIPNPNYQKRGHFMFRCASGVSHALYSYLRESPATHNDQGFVFLTYPDDVMIGWLDMCKKALHKPRAFNPCTGCLLDKNRCCAYDEKMGIHRPVRRWSI